MSKGQYKITTDHDRRLVYIFAEGEFNKASGEKLITEARLQAAESKYPILCNVQKTNTNVSLADWFFLPRNLSVYKNPETRFIKTAIVVSMGPQAKEYSFFEDVAQNVGIKIKIFFDEADALEWLKK